MYETDPLRDPNLLGCTQKPWCGEPRIELLTRDYFTPNGMFTFVLSYYLQIQF